MKTLLAIDGGGIRGLIAARVLAELEERTGKPVADGFDLVAGTSTGGILALGLSLPGDSGAPKYAAAELADLYREHGAEIFPQSRWTLRNLTRGVFDERYSAKGLERVLRAYFGDAPLGAALKPVLISSYDIQGCEPHFFKSWREPHRAVRMRDAARATSAAPTYFEPALVDTGGATNALVDGGVFINNPAMSAYAEARLLFPDTPEEDLRVVSVGTGALTEPLSYRAARGWGKLGWVRPLLDVMFDGVSDAVDYQLRALLNRPGAARRYYRLQTRLDNASDAMDDASEKNLDKLEEDAAALIRAHEADLDAIGDFLGARAT
jgi:hypothetical protein